MKRVFRKPHIYWAFGIFAFYLLLNIIISGFYNTIPLIIVYAKTVDWLKLGTSLFLTLAIGTLIAFNSVLIYIKYKERKECKKEVALSGAGAIGGLITGVCPICITGLVPLVLGLFGISFSLASLPLGGIEVQIIVALVLLASLYNLIKKNNQKI